jgi:hypothetical protein
MHSFASPFPQRQWASSLASLTRLSNERIGDRPRITPWSLGRAAGGKPTTPPPPPTAPTQVPTPELALTQPTPTPPPVP